MLFLSVFFIDHFTGKTKPYQNSPNQGASVKLKCHLTLFFALHNSDVNAVPFSDKII